MSDATLSVPTAPESETRRRGRRLAVAACESVDAPPRDECIGGPRPCERLCRYRLDASVSGESCALDVVDARGAMPLVEVAAFFGCTRERIRQIEVKARRKLTIAIARGAVLEGAVELLQSRKSKLAIKSRCAAGERQ